MSRISEASNRMAAQRGPPPCPPPEGEGVFVEGEGVTVDWVEGIRVRISETALRTLSPADPSNTGPSISGLPGEYRRRATASGSPGIFSFTQLRGLRRRPGRQRHRWRSSHARNLSPRA